MSRVAPLCTRRWYSGLAARAHVFSCSWLRCPSTPTWVCVDRGAGTPVIFENTIDSAQTFHGKRLRINLGKRDVKLWRNGKRVPVTPGADAVGFAFTPRHSRELQSGERPCL